MTRTNTLPADPSTRPEAVSSIEQRLSEVLRGVASATGALAAELWLLDEPSTCLQLRTSWEQARTLPPTDRPLHLADADVAALAGGAVVLEHLAEPSDWNVPRKAQAAVCLPVSSDRTLRGTMWLYWNEPQQLSDAEIEIFEIVAGRLAMEIECDLLRQADPFHAL